MIEAGSRVRLYSEGTEWAPTMRVSAVIADTLIVEEDLRTQPFAVQHRVPLSSLSRVDLSIGRRNRRMDAARFGAIGLVVGAVGGAVTGLVEYNNGPRNDPPPELGVREGRWARVRFYTWRVAPIGAAIGVTGALL